MKAEADRADQAGAENTDGIRWGCGLRRADMRPGRGRKRG